MPRPRAHAHPSLSPGNGLYVPERMDVRLLGNTEIPCLLGPSRHQRWFHYGYFVLHKASRCSLRTRTFYCGRPIRRISVA
jgi:hypothetical protein